MAGTPPTHPPKRSLATIPRGPVRIPPHLRSHLSHKYPSILRSERRSERIKRIYASQKRNAKNKPKPLSARERRKLCIDEISRKDGKWANFQTLRELWRGYAREILGLDNLLEYEQTKSNTVESKKGKGGVRTDLKGKGASSPLIVPQQAGPILASMDFHGAVIEVVRSRCESRVGVKGTVVQDRKFVFVVVTPNDKVKTLPKEHSVFRLEIPVLSKEDQEREKGEGYETRQPITIDLYGDHFEVRPTDRAKRSFKMKYNPDM
jgi:ribonuclease P protein subunit POP4